MIFNAENTPRCDVYVDGREIEQVGDVFALEGVVERAKLDEHGGLMADADGIVTERIRAEKEIVLDFDKGSVMDKLTLTYNR